MTASKGTARLADFTKASTNSKTQAQTTKTAIGKMERKSVELKGIITSIRAVGQQHQSSMHFYCPTA
jgi:hypothetical protein